MKGNITGMKNYKLTVAYEGTAFKGWQRQKEDRTVQGVIEEAAARICGRKVTVNGAGRTDAGVHALAQTASFQASVRLDDATFLRAMNAILPADVRAVSLEEAPLEFHARKSAAGKVYRYRIATGPIVSPFERRYALHWPYRLDLKDMRLAAAGFIGRHDFTAFSSNCDRSPVRTVVRSEFHRTGGILMYTVEADGFLRYMVRTMVGALLEVGRGRLEPDDIGRILESRDRKPAGPTAPPTGLFLVEVLYRPTA